MYSKEMSAIVGIFQIFRYAGSIMFISLLGLVFDNLLISAGLRSVALVMTVVSIVLLVAAVATSTEDAL